MTLKTEQFDAQSFIPSTASSSKCCRSRGRATKQNGFVSDECLASCDCEIDSLTKLLKSFRVGYRPPAHHALIVKTKDAIEHSSFFNDVEGNDSTKRQLANSVRWLIQHRIDHYKMVVSYILRAPDPYKHQTKAKGTGGSPTPTFLPKIFTHSIDR